MGPTHQVTKDGPMLCNQEAEYGAPVVIEAITTQGDWSTPGLQKFHQIILFPLLMNVQTLKSVY
jgi:hypothetical protein